MRSRKKALSPSNIPVLSLKNGPSSPPPASSSQRLHRLSSALTAPIVDIALIKQILWLGIPEDAPLTHRADAWRLVLGYLPVVTASREQQLERKRRHYQGMYKQHCDADVKCESDQKTLKQIQVDLPRTNQSLRLFKDKRVQKLMERVLYIWSVRNPASGYVQGINDLLVLFVAALSRPYMGCFSLDTDAVDRLTERDLEEIEADSFYCLSRILSHMQDNYTENQPGVYKSLNRLKDLMKRIDMKLCDHLEALGIDFMQFPFRWMNCLMIRELPLDCAIRLWDTYIAEINEGIVAFHEYVSAVFLSVWSEELLHMDYQQCLLFLQRPPTLDWGIEEVDAVISKAFVLQSAFHNSPNHLM
ncbi:TBC domain containing protein, putative [Babesia bigemina]|uniref:TBC domain containing protein, putative n=1 Tax=Babesia bigemina TaxID=5866 RepID=A0A061D3A7_BABBI|nr:TBC domain containing protein, putative [Babesia bigemina]CDR95083.1 TBC domain containing protein, putative [Babesia bigemina]|eukprot:XP_012767269.1 TBC domain containing protein, putative [Babesia bigemina]